MRPWIAALSLAVGVAACTSSKSTGDVPADESPSEDDWSLPAWAVASTNAGFFSEIASAQHDVNVHVVDLSWRQLEPAPGVFDTAAALAIVPPYYEDLGFASLADQLAEPGDYWLRFWISDVNLAPEWITTECAGLAPIDGTGYENDEHFPVWDACFWSHALDAYRHLLQTVALREDPRLRLAYVPGAFTYCEFDFDLVETSAVSFATFDAWFQQAMTDLAAIANGENADPADDFAVKLVYTGEDYPFSGFGAADDLLARDAVAAGLGIRTGITELFDFHLNHVPAYGTTIGADGHMVTDETWDAFEPGRVRATENECYDDCGYTTDVPYYAVKMSNLKALQLRMNWIYVVPEPSFMDDFPELWEWVRLSLGKTAADSPDAWVALREGEDLYWREDTSHTWDGMPFVKNWERWLVQRDVSPGGVSHRGTEVRRNVTGGDGADSSGTAYEGRRTNIAGGDTFLAFDVDEAFLSGAAGSIAIKVTWLDDGATWSLEYATAAGAAASTVGGAGSGQWITSTITLEDAVFDDGLDGSMDFRLSAGETDLEVRFVRIVKLNPP